LYDSFIVFRINEVKRIPAAFLIIASAIALVSHAGPAPAQDQIVFPEMYPALLLNGLQTYVASTPYLGDEMAVGFMLRYGSVFDPAKKVGLAYLTSRLLGKATTDRSGKDIQEELKYLEARLDISCDWDGIRLIIHARSDTYERCLLLLYQIVCEARFDEADFAQEKDLLLRELEAPEDPRLAVRGQFEAELFRGTAYGRPMRGTPATVRGIEIGDVRYFYRLHFSPDQAALVVVGATEPPSVLPKIRRIWGVWVRSELIPFTFLPAKEPGARNIFLFDEPGSPAAQYILGNLWPRRDDPSYYAGLLAVRILQSRLTRELPTSRLTVAAEGRRLPGPFYVQGQAAAAEAAGEIKKILETVESLKNGRLAASEIAAEQDLWIGELAKSLRTVDGVCGTLLDSELYRLGVNYISSASDFIRRSGPDRVQEAMKGDLFPGGLVLIVRGPAAVLKPQLESLGTVQSLPR
jgi:predicted Zn-dependent peptidase